MQFFGAQRIVHGFFKTQNVLTSQTRRTLFSEKLLRISDYERQRMAAPHFRLEKKQLLYELRSNDVRALTKTMNKWFLLMGKQECEANFPLIRQCLCCIFDEKVRSPESVTRDFSAHVMRMLHFLNLPHRALELSNDQYIAEMFHRRNTQIILCDMLFNNALYEELQQIFQQNRRYQQCHGYSSSRYQNLLLFAACFKLNTEHYFEYALQIWIESVEEHQITQSKSFLGMLAINQDQPKTALDILSDMDKNLTSVIVRIIALSDLGEFDLVEQIMRNTLVHMGKSNQRFSWYTIQRIRKSIRKHRSPEQSISLQNLLHELQQTNLSNVTIDEMLCSPVHIEHTTETGKDNEKSSEDEVNVEH